VISLMALSFLNAFCKIFSRHPQEPLVHQCRFPRPSPGYSCWSSSRLISTQLRSSPTCVNLVDSDVIAAGYRDVLFVDGLYGSACKEIDPFNGSNSGSLWIRTAEVSWAVAATKASASETD
jgi:hypothetical protein